MPISSEESEAKQEDDGEEEEGCGNSFLPERQVQQQGGWGGGGRRREKRHLTTAGLNYPGACVFLNVFVRLRHYRGGLRPLAPGGEQQVREHGDYKNTSRQLALVLTACKPTMGWIALVCRSSTG